MDGLRPLDVDEAQSLETERARALCPHTTGADSQTDEAPHNGEWQRLVELLEDEGDESGTQTRVDVCIDVCWALGHV